MILALLAAPAVAQTLTLRGLAGAALTVSQADLDALPGATVSLPIHGQTHVFQGPLLIDVLARAGAPRGPALHGPELADAVVASARDGYRVVLGLGEVDPTVRPNRVILADRMDGAPLPATDGPFRLVIEGDLEPKRAARMITEIDVVRVGDVPGN
jgi:hypothetical protein